MDLASILTVDQGVSSHPFTANLSSLNTSQNVADAKWNKELKVALLWIQIVIGTVGGCIVCAWLWCDRRRKSRVNVILLHVTLSDLLVMATTLTEVVWEMHDRWWLAGDAMCRLIKFFQSFSMLASSYMLVLLSFDRHQAIRTPLRTPPAVWRMALPCWLVAAVLSIPMFFLFKVVLMLNEESIFYNMVICETVFRWMPKIHRQVFLTSISVIHVFMPCILITVCYVRIFLKIAEKANVTGSTESMTMKMGKAHIQCLQSQSLSKAKVKTLKMTVVIVTMFIVCGLPYHILEMFYNFWEASLVPPQVSAVLGALPVANSVVNPYIFLLFNTKNICRKRTPARGAGYLTDPRAEHMTQFRKQKLANNLTDQSLTRTLTPNGARTNTHEYVPLRLLNISEQHQKQSP